MATFKTHPRDREVTGNKRRRPAERHDIQHGFDDYEEEQKTQAAREVEEDPLEQKWGQVDFTRLLAKSGFDFSALPQ